MFCFCMQAYAKLCTDTPELLDLVAQFGGQDVTDDPMAVDGHSSAPVANSGEFVSNKNNKSNMIVTIIIIITIKILIMIIVVVVVVVVVTTIIATIIPIDIIRMPITITTIQALSSS